MDTWVLIAIVLQFTNFLIHIFGCYLLASIFREGNGNIQLVYLLNLGISEAVINFLGILLTPLSSFGTFSTATISATHQVQYSIMIVLETGVLLVYYLCMVYITLDKLFEVKLNIKYPIYMNERRAKYLMIVTWIACLGFGSFVCIWFHTVKNKLEEPFVKYVYPTLDIGYLVLASVSYVIIFQKFKESRSAPLRHRLNKGKKLNTFQVFRKSNFYVSGLLIASFILLMVIPDLVYLVIGILKAEKTDELVAYCFLSILLSYFVDGFIYILLQRKVRMKLKKKIKKWKDSFEIQKITQV